MKWHLSTPLISIILEGATVTMILHNRWWRCYWRIQDFTEGAPTPKVGAQIYDFGHFFLKWHEKARNRIKIGPRGGDSICEYSVRSATGHERDNPYYTFRANQQKAWHQNIFTKGPFALGNNDVFFSVVMCEQLHWWQCNPSLTTC